MLMSCPYCRADVAKAAPYCPSCGGPIRGRSPEQITGRNAVVVLVACLLGPLAAVAAFVGMPRALPASPGLAWAAAAVVLLVPLGWGLIRSGRPR